MNFHVGLPEWPFITAVELIRCIFSQFLFSKKHFPTDFKVTQDKSRREDVLNETPIESVVANLMKFDIFLPLVVFGTTLRGFFDILDALSTLKKLEETTV